MVQASLNDEKSGGQKSRWTVPLKLKEKLAESDVDQVKKIFYFIYGSVDAHHISVTSNKSSS